MITPIKWLNEAFEYDEAHPHYVDGVKQGSLRSVFFFFLGVMVTIIVILAFF